MKIYTHPFFETVKQDALYGKNAVMIDALRASSTIIAAVSNGCDRIIPTEDMEQAVELYRRSEYDKKLLCGESGSQKLAEYDLGNSPLEFTPEAVGGSVLIMSTTNGTRALIRLFKAENVLVASFVNALAAAERLAESGRDVVIACAGDKGRTAAEDLLAAGCLLKRLIEAAPAADVDDLGQIAIRMYELYLKGEFDLRSAALHYRELEELGFNEDIAFCLREDVTNAVPVYMEGVITK